MRKIFTLIAMFATVGVLSMQAQVFQKAPVKFTTNALRTQRAAIQPGANQTWWGYAGSTNELTGVGVGQADTYHCAIFIPGNHSVAGGKTIHAVRFGLISPNAKDAKVWIAKSKPTTINATNCLQVVDVPQSALGSLNIEVPLNEPYAIPAEGVYVGYSFTISKVQYSADGYPILLEPESSSSNTLLIKADNTVPNWSDESSNFGYLFLHVLLEGDSFADNIVTPRDFGSVYAEVGNNATGTIKIDNQGVSPVSSINFVIGNDGQEFHADINPAIPAYSRGYIGTVIPAEAEQSIKNKTLTITKVNGNDNNADDKTASFTLYSLSEIISRSALVEQFTGTGCGYCPRGHVGMAKMRAAFGNRFAGVAIHQYSNQSSDAMYIDRNSYAKHGMNGAPSARINRGEVVDPYYGTGSDVLLDMEAALAIPAMANLQVSGTFDETNTKVDANAKFSPLFDGTYKLEFVLIADGLKGSGTGWNQTNYYVQYDASQVEEDLADVCSGGKYGTNPIQGYTFNDVAIASSYVSGSNQISAQTLTAGENAEVSYTLNLPTYAKLKNALQMDQIYVIAVLIASDGSVANVAKVKVADYDPTAISGIHTATATEAARYTLDGRQVSAPQRGLNIIRLSDGTVRKVIVK